MGLWNKLRNEFIDIIEWVDDTNNTLVYKFERYQNEIKNGAKLTVREGQLAILVNEGKMADIYKPGMHTLNTSNMPILSTIMGWKYGFDSPFKVDVYFVSTRDFIDRKWGTKNPVMLRDPEFGPIRIRAFGNFAFRAKDAEKLLKRLVSTDARFTTEEIQEQLRNIIVARFSDVMGESKIPILDAASNYNEFSTFLTQNIQSEFEEYGLELTKLLVENISLPPEVEQMLDKRTSMGIVGDLHKFMQFQAANALEKAAENPGGEASTGMGLGMGFGMANQMMNAFQPNAANSTPTPPPLPGQSTYYAALNGQQAGPFPMATLQQMIQSGQINRDTLVWKTGMEAWTAAGSVSELSSFFGAMPPPLP